MIKTLNKKESTKILVSNYIGNLSYIYRDRPYIVPITYFYDKNNNAIIGYSAEGHKINAMRKNCNVSLGVSEVDSVNSWESVLAQGKFIEFSGSEAKAKLHIFSLGVKNLIINREHRKLDFISEFSSKSYKDDLPVVFQIKIEEITGRMRRN
ncbi:pyridoxamine 5'-phosphate oxidase family protein [Mariniflexile litorale]|uniref:Pyridoxamine 5'-phosphate oxidase family protein n=1 Tax=Mariniflexile litorale TaxID=3045158 RepID=A0AAU7EFC8_9FLAO|nr:pyridoxamine 5'-phosphate oxidase family protein [Mariniflexile sp. KMM 9835]MDQ8212420.1 pyridoxamine 5'-phosphate oxidase family protein [Mariniflexile sp. KMM 9835]